MSREPDPARRLRILLILGVAAATWVVYLYGAVHSPLLDPAAASRQTYVSDIARRRGAIDAAAEHELAELYWNRYSDVAADAYFGRSGRLGVFGAREHYQRHGRREGRVWGPGQDPGKEKR